MYILCIHILYIQYPGVYYTRSSTAAFNTVTNPLPRLSCLKNVARSMVPTYLSLCPNEDEGWKPLVSSYSPLKYCVAIVREVLLSNLPRSTGVRRHKICITPFRPYIESRIASLVPQWTVSHNLAGVSPVVSLHTFWLLLL
jgi:hypothetical protein